MKPIMLFAWQDLGASMVVPPLAVEAIKLGDFDVHCIASGAGAEKFLDGQTLKLDNEGKRPPEFNLAVYIHELFGAKKGIVVLGEGDASKGETFESEVSRQVVILNKLRANPLPVMVVKDGWGIQSRLLHIQPDGFLTLDESNHDLLKNIFPHILKSHINVVGNHALRKVRVGPHVQGLFAGACISSPEANLIYFSGGHPRCTGEELALLTDCLKQTSCEWVLVYGFHPTWRDQYGENWRGLLKSLSSEKVFEAPNKSGDECAALADVTIADISTVMGTAAYHGHAVISLYPESTQKFMWEMLGFEESPHVALGLASKVTKPQDLSSLFGPPDPAVAAKLKPFNPQEGLRHIIRLLV